MNVLKTLSESMVTGNHVAMNRTVSRHLQVRGENDPAEIPSEASFADLVRKGMNAANDAQMDSQEIFTQMITSPNSVEAHDVSIAMAKANMTLQMTKSIVDGAVKAYKDIINMR